MSLNQKPPYRLFCCISNKEKELIKSLWPKMNERLQKKFNTKFNLDFDYNLFYDSQKATKQEVLDVIGEVFHQYYFGA